MTTMRRHQLLPSAPTGYPLWPDVCPFAVVVPEAGTNLLTNPNVEAAAWDAIGTPTTHARSTAWQMYGLWSMHVVTDAASEGSSPQPSTIGVASGQAYTASVYVNAVRGRLRLEIREGATVRAASKTVHGGYEGRLTVTHHAASSTNYRVVIVSVSTVAEWYTDAAQFEAQPYATTFFDGWQGYLVGTNDVTAYQWNGTVNASTSTRSVSTRTGGKLVRLDQLGFQITAAQGLGMGPLEHVATPFSLTGGAMFQRTLRQVRTFALVGMFTAASLSQLYRDKAALEAAIKPDHTDQPILLRYQAHDACGDPHGPELEIACRYVSGLEGNTDNLYQERVALEFVQHVPTIYAVGSRATTLDINEEITDANYIVERQANGVMHALAGGTNGTVYTALYLDDGTAIIGGTFTVVYNGAGGTSAVTVNRIARWTPDTTNPLGGTWSAIGATPGFANGQVNALAKDAAGNVYAGGTFTDAAHPYLAMFPAGGTDWEPPSGTAADATGTVHALAYMPQSGWLHIGGDFANWDANANADRIVVWTGTQYLALAGGVSGQVLTIDVAPNGDIYLGGFFQTAYNAAAASSPLTVNRIAKWRWMTGQYSALGSGVGSGVQGVYAVRVGPDGWVYAAGDFESAGGDTAIDYVAKSNGQIWQPLGAGVSGAAAWELSFPPRGTRWTHLLAVGGGFTSAGGQTVNDHVAAWNIGGAWVPLPIDLPGTPNVYAIAHHPDGERVLIGFDTAGTATSSNVSETTVTNDGSAETAPIIVLIGPGRVESIQNWTTGDALYFDLTLNAGERATLNLTPGEITFWSDYRGNLLASGALLLGSDRSNFRLARGDNTILVKWSGTTSGATAFFVAYRPTHDGLPATVP